MAEILFRTDRLLLRTEAETDRAVWMAHMNCAEVMAHLGGVQKQEQVEAAFDRMQRALQETGWPFLLIALKDDGTLIGKCGLAPIETEEAPSGLRGQIQIGWTVRPDMWGRGYAHEAAEAMLDFAFEHRQAERIIGQTSQGNIPSWRLMEKLGMNRRADLDYIDPAYPPQDNPTIIFAIERGQWDALAKDHMP